MAWLSDWRFRVPIVVDHTKVDSPLTDFPIALFLPAEVVTNGGFLEQNPAIAVTTDDEQTECYVELLPVDRWNEIGRIPIYFRAPSISSDTDTVFYLYFDRLKTKSSMVGFTGEASAQQVWDTNFVAVLHLVEKTSEGVYLDSTANQWNGTPVGLNDSHHIKGKVDRAVWFDGSGDEINVGPFGYDLTQWTIEIVAYTDTITSNDKTLLANDFSGWGDSLMFGIDPESGAINLPNDKIGFSLQSSEETRSYGAHSMSLEVGSWFYTALKGDYPVLKLFVNDVPESFTAQASNVNLDNYTFTVGQNKNVSRPWSGGVDEVRISKVARTDSWIKATFYSLFGQLLSLGDYEFNGVSSLEYSPVKSSLVFPRTSLRTQGRSFNRFGGGSIAGTVNVLGAPAKRRVSLLDRRSMKVLAVTWSDPVTGAYEFQGFDPRFDYLVVCDDYTKTYNAAAADWVKPEVS